jgi:aryl-alcohol dehydrogenase-like predicted oxidoreductase
VQYRTHEGESLSEIGVGGYGLSGVYGPREPERFVELVHRAHALGVTFFDVADVYGPAEEVLGRAVAPFRDQVWIATKVGAGADGKPDCSPEHVLSSCEQSLQRLQTDFIDLYQVHFNDPHTPVEGTVAALEELRVAGKIRYYGVGHVPLPRMRAYFAAGEVFSALVELNAAARGAREQVLPLCQAEQVAVIAFSATGRGLLTGKFGPGHVFPEGDIRRLDPLFQRERFASGLRVAERFQALGAKYGRSSVQVAIAWVLTQPAVLCALTGPSSIPHLEENLGASGWSVAQDDLAELECFFQEEDERLHREQVRSVRSILGQELDRPTAFADLVYVFETVIELNLATEEEILPLFQQLWPLRGQHLDAAALERMGVIHAELAHRFSPQLADEDSGAGE